MFIVTDMSHKNYRVEFRYSDGRVSEGVLPGRSTKIIHFNSTEMVATDNHGGKYPFEYDPLLAPESLGVDCEE